MALDWTAWGTLASRYRTSGPRRILALDGGGIRGVITLGVLAALERRLRERRGDPDYRLCQFFDLIGGTSTGAIIATALARGMAVAEIADFYEQFGSTAFRRMPVWERWHALYGDGGLVTLLKRTFGADTDLHPENLRCLLTVVTRNATTDSAWPISSNPAAVYNDRTRPDCNLRIPLWQLVRASTAAPVYFPPEILQWDPRDPSKTFVFADGGVTPYNNPSFVLYRMATEPAYRLNWKTGEKNLLLISVGTGAAESQGATAAAPNKNILSTVAGMPGELMYGSLVDQDINCRTVGRCTYGANLDREVLDLVP